MCLQFFGLHQHHMDGRSNELQESQLFVVLWLPQSFLGQYLKNQVEYQQKQA